MSERRDFQYEPTVKQRVENDLTETVKQAARRASADEPLDNRGGSESELDIIPYRPLYRPPTAAVCVLFDDGQGGEWHTVRTATFRFGRREGDVVISHDDQISTVHCELSRRLEDGEYRWYLKDLESRNGTFVRVTRARLSHNSELLIGCHCYRFDARPQSGHLDEESSTETEEGTKGWRVPTASDVGSFQPALVRLGPQGEAERFLLPQPEQIVGNVAGQAALVLAGDQMMSPVHCRIYRDDKRRWNVEDLKSLNGTWIRVSEKLLNSDAQFQIGEQRIIVRFA